MRKFHKFIINLMVAMLFLSVTGAARPDAGAQAAMVQPQLFALADAYPDQVVAVIVQKVDVNDQAEKLVALLGGQITQDLGIINAFVAALPAQSAVELSRSSAIRWVSLNAPMQSTALGDASVRDTFSEMSYSNNDGTEQWHSAWMETGDGSPSPSSGSLRISSGALVLQSSNRTLSRAADLSGAASATLNFDYKRARLDSAYDYVALQISADGGWSWRELARFKGPGSDWSWRSASFDITGYASAETSIRFVTSAWLGWSDSLVVDNIQIEYAAPAPELPPAAIPESTPWATETNESSSTPTSCEQCVDITQLENTYNRAIQAEQAWNNPPYLHGQGIGVAVIDSGVNPNGDLYTNLGVNRQIADVRFNTDYNQSPFDGYGHGTVISSIIGGDGSDSAGKYIGVAPMVNIINVKVSNDDGSSTTADVIDGLQWVLEHKEQYNIRVVNISLNGMLAESYHTSPLDAAVEILWFNEIVVVASAGNQGNGAIHPPANDPFIITVGATDDRGTASLSDDVVGTFSAYGTTGDGLKKPDLVAPGKDIIGRLVNANMGMAGAHLTNVIPNGYFKMSGTSVSAPMVSGAAALLLQDEPDLTPDQVKYRLMATANQDWPGYNPVQAGAGYLDIGAAVNGTTTESANTGTPVSNLLTTGPDGVLGPTVQWSSVQWSSVQWSSVQWSSDYWGP